MTLNDRISELVQKYGSLRATARVLQVDHAYLYRLQKGHKINPSPLLLRRLGLRRIVIVDYRRRRT